MNRAIRNRLADLLLGAFHDATKRDAILWLSLYCELHIKTHRVDVPVTDLQAEWGHRHGDLTRSAQRFGHVAADLEGLLHLPSGDGVWRAPDRSSRSGDAAGFQVEPHSDLLPHLVETCERVRTYSQVVQQVGAQQGALSRMAPLRRAVAEAAACFNVGLFFEAHEHLEHHWVSLPPSPTKRYIQGIIQVSVGFHHVMRGSYDGAVNQLEKGLAKLVASCGDVVGLDENRFRREVAEVRRRIVDCGRERMRRPRLDELPRMHLTH